MHEKGKKCIEFSRVLVSLKVKKMFFFSLKENKAYSISDLGLYKGCGGWKWYYKIAAPVQLKLIHILQREEISSVMIFMLHKCYRKFQVLDWVIIYFTFFTAFPPILGKALMNKIQDLGKNEKKKKKFMIKSYPSKSGDKIFYLKIYLSEPRNKVHLASKILGYII